MNMVCTGLDETCCQWTCLRHQKPQGAVRAVQFSSEASVLAAAAAASIAVDDPPHPHSPLLILALAETSYNGHDIASALELVVALRPHHQGTFVVMQALVLRIPSAVDITPHVSHFG
jgi:hypothetical protein